MDVPHDRLVSVRCPNCGARADVLVAWRDQLGGDFPEILEFRCRNRCAVDDETLRNVLGAA